MMNDKIHSSMAESIEYRLLLTTLRLLLVCAEEPGILKEEEEMEPFVMESWLRSAVLPLLPSSSS